MQIEKEINIKDVFYVIKKKMWIVLICVILFGSVGYAYISRPVTPLYEASARIYVQAGNDLLNNLRVILREPFVLDEVIRQLELNRTAESLRSRISIDSVGTSTVLVVSVTDQNQQVAVDVANTIVSAYKSVSRNTVFSTHVMVLTEAIASENPLPINERSSRPFQLSVIIGLIIGLGLIFFVDSLDDTIRNERDIEQFGDLTVLGYVSKIKRHHISKKVTKQRNLSLRGETLGS